MRAKGWEKSEAKKKKKKGGGRSRGSVSSCLLTQNEHQSENVCVEHDRCEHHAAKMWILWLTKQVVRGGLLPWDDTAHNNQWGLWLMKRDACVSVALFFHCVSHTHTHTSAVYTAADRLSCRSLYQFCPQRTRCDVSTILFIQSDCRASHIRSYWKEREYNLNVTITNHPFTCPWFESELTWCFL